jgi:hypothetical protein
VVDASIGLKYYDPLCALCVLCERIKKLLAEIAERDGVLKMDTPIWSYWLEILRCHSADFAFLARGKKEASRGDCGDCRDEIK